MLLYLVKHSRPDIANAVRELSKVMDDPTIYAMKELNRIIKFVLDTSDYGLKIDPEPNENEKLNKWNLKVYTDSDYAGDKDTRIFLLNVPILWRSKAQRSVTLSSSEAEYVALSEAAKDVKFVVQLLKSIGVEVRLPVVINVDNIGAIFMSENVSTTNRTKHVDVRYHFVREFIEDGFVKIVFVRSKENAADIFTKNVNGEIYNYHSNTMVVKKNYLND